MKIFICQKNSFQPFSFTFIWEPEERLNSRNAGHSIIDPIDAKFSHQENLQNFDYAYCKAQPSPSSADLSNLVITKFTYTTFNTIQNKSNMLIASMNCDHIVR